MTTQERLRAAAKRLEKSKPRLAADGEYLDELLTRAADEMDRQLEMFAMLALEKHG
jgi:hypothetical protein